jgi:hypothetical protein
LIFVVHEQQQGGSHIRHSLHIPDVRPIHSKRLENSVELVVVDPFVLEYASKLREGPWDVGVDDEYATLSCLVFSLGWLLVLLRFDVD